MTRDVDDTSVRSTRCKCCTGSNCREKIKNRLRYDPSYPFKVAFFTTLLLAPISIFGLSQISGFAKGHGYWDRVEDFLKPNSVMIIFQSFMTIFSTISGGMSIYLYEKQDLYDLRMRWIHELNLAIASERGEDTEELEVIASQFGTHNNCCSGLLRLVNGTSYQDLNESRRRDIPSSDTLRKKLSNSLDGFSQRNKRILVYSVMGVTSAALALFIYWLSTSNKSVHDLFEKTDLFPVNIVRTVFSIFFVPKVLADTTQYLFRRYEKRHATSQDTGISLETTHRPEQNDIKLSLSMELLEDNYTPTLND